MTKKFIETIKPVVTEEESFYDPKIVQGSKNIFIRQIKILINNYVIEQTAQFYKPEEKLRIAMMKHITDKLRKA